MSTPGLARAATCKNEKQKRTQAMQRRLDSGEFEAGEGGGERCTLYNGAERCDVGHSFVFSEMVVFLQAVALKE